MMSQRIAISLTRFSTPEQEQGYSMERQINLAKAICKQKGWKLDPELIARGVSGFNPKKIGKIFDQLLTTPPKCVVIVEDLDRLSRMPPLMTLDRIRELLKTGRTIFVCKTGIEYSQESLEDDFFQLLGLLFENFRSHSESDRKRTLSQANAKKRHERARSDGTPVTSWVPWGYKVNSKREIIINKEPAAIVKKIFRLASQGFGCRVISRKLNLQGIKTARGKQWTSTTVTHILKNRSYLGEFRPTEVIDGKRVPVGEPIIDYYPQIIDSELWKKKESYEGVRKHSYKKKKDRVFLHNDTSNLFTGLMFCARCGSPMYGVQRVTHNGRQSQCRMFCRAAWHKHSGVCGQTFKSLPRLWTEASIVNAILQNVDVKVIADNLSEPIALAEIRSKISHLQKWTKKIEKEIDSGLDLLLEVSEKLRPDLQRKLNKKKSAHDKALDDLAIAQNEYTRLTISEDSLLERLTEIKDVAVTAIFRTVGGLKVTKSVTTLEEIIEAGRAIQPTKDEVESARLKVKHALRDVVNRIELDTTNGKYSIILLDGTTIPDTVELPHVSFSDSLASMFGGAALGFVLDEGGKDARFQLRKYAEGKGKTAEHILTDHLRIFFPKDFDFRRILHG